MDQPPNGGGGAPDPHHIKETGQSASSANSNSMEVFGVEGGAAAFVLVLVVLGMMSGVPRAVLWLASLCCATSTPMAVTPCDTMTARAACVVYMHVWPTPGQTALSFDTDL
jgi:hypothetical protein